MNNTKGANSPIFGTREAPVDVAAMARSKRVFVFSAPFYFNNLMTFAWKNNDFIKNFLNLFSIQASNSIIQILLFPIIIHVIGIESFGYVAVANSYAGLLNLFINYGTNLSGIKDVAVAKGDKNQLAKIFFNIIHTRSLLFVVSCAVPLALYFFHFAQISYLLFATPIIFAEAINPFFFFNGIERLSRYNLANLAAKICSAALIISFVKGDTNPAWVNFFLGITNLTFFAVLAVFAVRKYKLPYMGFSLSAAALTLRTNFFLVCNNLATHLQQSFYLFLLSFTVTPIVLGAYSLCDKLIWSFRNLLVSFANALYPKAALTYKEDRAHWPAYKRRMNAILVPVFIVVTLFLFFGSDLVVFIFTGGHNMLASFYIKTVCFVPLIATLNSLNIIELLIKDQYRLLFYTSVVLLIVTVITSVLFVTINHPKSFGWYAVLIELASLIITVYFLRSRRSNVAIPGVSDSAVGD